MRNRLKRSLAGLAPWTARTSGTAEDLNSIDYAPNGGGKGIGMWVACGENGALLWSLDFITWNVVSSWLGIATDCNVVRHLGGITDTAEEDGVEGSQRLERFVRHHLAALEVTIAAPVEDLEVDTESVGRGCSLCDSGGFRRNLRPDAVAGNHGDLIVTHPSSIRPGPGGQTRTHPTIDNR